MAIDNADDLTAAVLATMQRTPDARLRELTTALVRHLHAFVRETALTDAEFRDATALLVRMGQLCDERHNEFVLMAGSLGVSALVCLLNHTDPATGTASHNLLGPFWRDHSPAVAQSGTLLRGPTPGTPMLIELRVVDRAGSPVEGAEVDLWHCAPNGLYENQDDAQADHNLRGRLVTDADGTIRCTSVRPVGYPIPVHTVVGELLRAQGRHPMRPAHLHAMVFKPGCDTLVTQLYDADDPHLHSDTQFGTTAALTVSLQRHDAPHPTLDALQPPWVRLAHTLVLAPGTAPRPRAPIR